MAISFPLNPSIGDEYSASGKTWTWNGAQWEGVPATSGIPYGTTANRPATPELGQPYFNADDARLEMYTTLNGWQNIIKETPTVVSISGVYAESNPSNTITINGTNFEAGSIAYAVGTNSVEVQADSTTLVSVAELSATFSGLVSANEPYDIKVVNPSNLYGMIFDGLQVDDIPVWLVQSGTLGTYIEESAMSILSSTYIQDDEGSPLIFSVASGSLPAGLSLNTSTGEISGTPTDVIPNTTYSFILSATDGNNTTTRSFSITITDRGPVWSTGQTLSSFSKDIAYSETVSATDDNGIFEYSLTAGSLPTGLALNTSTGEISGTPTLDATAIFTIRATDNGGNFSDRQFTIPNTGPAWQTDSNINIITNGQNSVQLSAIDDSGIAPTYSVVSGALPSGISLSTSGLLSGISTESIGTITVVTIRAEDNNGIVSDKQFAMTSVEIFNLYDFATISSSASNSQLYSTTGGSAEDFDVSPDGNWMIIADYSGGMEIFPLNTPHNPLSGTNSPTLLNAGVTGAARGVAFDTSGQYVYFAYDNDKIVAAEFDTSTGSINNPVNYSIPTFYSARIPNMRNLTYIPDPSGHKIMWQDASYYLVTVPANGTLLDTANTVEIGPVPNVAYYFTAALFINDGVEIIMGDQNGFIEIRNVATAYDPTTIASSASSSLTLTNASQLTRGYYIHNGTLYTVSTNGPTVYEW